MSEFSHVLGVKFNNVTHLEAVNILMNFLKDDKCRMVFTPNPEIVMEAKKDKEFMKILNSADLVVPDGIGVVIASKLTKEKLKERVAGYDLIQGLFSEIKDKDYTVCFFGGAPGVAEDAKRKMENIYKGLKIIDVFDGYFDKKKEKLILDNIKNKKPDILLVGLGAPKQEKWIYSHRDELPVKICAGVGGSFDGMSGNVKRAPDFFIKLGLEWFYRLLRQPSRFFRMMKLPLFLLAVIKEKLTGKDGV